MLSGFFQSQQEWALGLLNRACKCCPEQKEQWPWTDAAKNSEFSALSRKNDYAIYVQGIRVWQAESGRSSDWKWWFVLAFFQRKNCLLTQTHNTYSQSQSTLYSCSIRRVYMRDVWSHPEGTCCAAKTNHRGLCTEIKVSWNLTSSDTKSSQMYWEKKNKNWSLTCFWPGLCSLW